MMFVFSVLPFAVYLWHKVKVSSRRANKIVLGDSVRAKERS
jgi:hypothetical protein